MADTVGFLERVTLDRCTNCGWITTGAWMHGPCPVCGGERYEAREYVPVPPEALAHIAALLNHCGASPGPWDDEENRAASGGYQPKTMEAQAFLAAKGGGWADGAGWLAPEQFRATKTCAYCDKRFQGPAGPCVPEAPPWPGYDGPMHAATRAEP